MSGFRSTLEERDFYKEQYDRLLSEKVAAIEGLQLAKDIISDTMRTHGIYPSVENFKFIEQVLNRLRGKE